MAIGDIIPATQVLVGLRVGDKTRLLQELATRAAPAVALDPMLIFTALQAREDLGSTGLGRGFAVPHARLEGLRDRYAMFVRLARPIEFQAIDGRPVDLVILLLTSADASNEHLATLAALSRPMRETGFLQRLRSAADEKAVHRLLAGA